ncbi:SDR family NAD(P)-dependent oxidoreductase [Bradyrhizobium genosp. P]|uniref:SDR family NAD(P)-dependent oxidoreductase n=1 Tax=Bradyrhizobium genosp. P TaxID=83641 RepID=UPI003CEFADE7
MKLAGKRILVTGGSSGIGFEIARSALAKGARLIITGRNTERLSRAARGLADAKGEVIPLVADVATGDGRAEMLEATRDRLGGLDILVNNAGAVRAGRLENISEREIRAMIETNLVAPILLTRACLPELRKGREGMVVNIASSSAVTGVPFYSPYAGTKSGLVRFGESLRRELKGEGVHVLVVYPGATETPMMATSKAGPESGYFMESAASVAAAVIAGIEANAFEVTRGGKERAQVVALNREDPGQVDEAFLAIKLSLEEAVRDHKAL